MNFAVIGGDLRICRLCAMLAADGHQVETYALENSGFSLRCRASAQLAAENAHCVIFPLPICMDSGELNAPLLEEEHDIHDVIDILPQGVLACGGLVDEAITDYAGHRGIKLLDYLDREEMAVSNAVAAAEGALGLIMQEMPITVWGCRVLVVGFGRLGKMLAHRLRGMGAMVSVSARNYGDIAWIEAYGYRALRTESLEGELGKFDVVVNTVPSLVLGQERLRELKPDVFCLDLASRPGGLDFPAAARLGIRAVWALSLPGQVAPLTSGGIIKETIYNIASEEGLM